MQKIIWSFAIAETLAWASYFYIFPAFLPIWEVSLGFSKTSLTGAFTLALLVSAVSSPVVGRLIDRGYAQVVFTGGAGFAALLLVLLSQVTELWQFYAIWAGLGLAMAGSLYDACFAIITLCLGKEAKRGITHVTLVAGFAGTLSFPSVYVLNGVLGWRGSLIIFAAIVALICVPLMAHGCYHALRSKDVCAKAPLKSIKQSLSVLSSFRFWMIGISFLLMSLSHGIIIAHMLSIFHDRGIGPAFAVVLASMLGPMQVVGRALILIFEAHTTTLLICISSLCAMLFAAIALYFGALAPPLVILFVIAQGAGWGVVSIIRPVIIAELLGRQDFGLVAGVLAMTFLIGVAFAPLLGSFLWESGGYDTVILITVFLPAFSAVFLVLAWRHQSSKPLEKHL